MVASLSQYLSSTSPVLCSLWASQICQANTCRNKSHSQWVGRNKDGLQNAAPTPLPERVPWNANKPKNLPSDVIKN